MVVVKQACDKEGRKNTERSGYRHHVRRPTRKDCTLSQRNRVEEKTYHYKDHIAKPDGASFCKRRDKPNRLIEQQTGET